MWAQTTKPPTSGKNPKNQDNYNPCSSWFFGLFLEQHRLMCFELFYICIKSSVIPPLKCVHMPSPCEMLPLVLVIRIKSLSSLFTAQHLSYCSPELHAWLGFFFLFGFVKDLISFLFMCVLTLAGAEMKKNHCTQMSWSCSSIHTAEIKDKNCSR